MYSAGYGYIQKGAQQENINVTIALCFNSSVKLMLYQILNEIYICVSLTDLVYKMNTEKEHQKL